MSSDALQMAGAERSERRVKKIRATTFSPLGLLGHLKDLAQYTDLIYTLSQHRVRVRYKQSVLGIAWAVMQPLSLMLIYTVIFSLVAKIETGGPPYAIFVFVGLLPWTYFSTALTSGTSALTSHINLITKVYFPREILPLTYVIAAFFDFIIAWIVLAAMMVYYSVPLTATAIYAIPIIAVMTVFVMAMALLFSATHVRFRDVGVGIPLLLQIWMFATPVVYPLSAVKSLSPTLRFIYLMNPMVGVIENFRRVVLQGVAPDFHLLGVSALISLVLLPIAYVYFKHVETTAADVI
jgi:homopolymeric O-antigen transport system permease protein